MATPPAPSVTSRPAPKRRRRRAPACRPACLLALSTTLAALPAGCAFDGPPAATGLSLTVTAPITIPPGSAHVVLQDGRLASAGNRLEPYCELEVRTVSGDQPQRITSGEFRVSRASHRPLRDPTTRIPALLGLRSCAEPIFQEFTWWLASTAPSDVMYLRCLAPYYNCDFGPPLSPAQVQAQVGRYLTIGSSPTPPDGGSAP
ncbi:hypothetical protein [Thiococcus pfennigii]|uniref:hypothetical protein n=1 Tax=Thiococcus pfennigii TaxID=1057 RepID=UPI00190658B8|nr:hypothetical protein [Thiococcus pfennigii]